DGTWYGQRLYVYGASLKLLQRRGGGCLASHTSQRFRPTGSWLRSNTTCTLIGVHVTSGNKFRQRLPRAAAAPAEQTRASESCGSTGFADDESRRPVHTPACGSVECGGRP